MLDIIQSNEERCAGCKMTATEIRVKRKRSVVVMIELAPPAKGDTAAKADKDPVLREPWKLCVQCYVQGLRDPASPT